VQPHAHDGPAGSDAHHGLQHDERRENEPRARQLSHQGDRQESADPAHEQNVDPAGQEAWDGDFRLVVMARSRLDEEVGTDPLLGSAAWSWLTDALDGAGAGYRALVGTVTRVLSETFGGLELNDACAHAEIRASWSPTTPDLTPHLEAWYELIHVAAGHEPEIATPIELTSVVR